MDMSEVSPFQPTVFGAMRRHMLLVMVCVVGVAGLGLAYGLWVTSDVSATASIVVEDPTASNGQGRSVDPNYPANQVAIIGLPSTSAAAALLVNEKVPDANIPANLFRDRLDVELDSTSNLIRIVFHDPRPAIAAAGANAVVTTYRRALDDRAKQEKNGTLQRIDNAIQVLSERISQNGDTDPASPDNQTRAQLQARRVQFVLDASTASTNGVVAESPATVPAVSSRGGVVRYGLLGALVGLLPAAGVSYLVASRRRRFSSHFDAELVLDRPLLAEIPDFRLERLPTDMPAFDRVASSAAEGFRFVASILDPDLGRGYVFTSASRGDGKSVVTANVAVTAAGEGKRVMAIDGDLGKGSLSWLFGVAADQPGLMQLLRGDVDVDKAACRVAPVPGELWLMPGGGSPSASSELFGSEKAAEVFAILKERFDLVVVDSPAMLEVAYAARLAQHMDSTLVVVSHRSDAGRLEDLVKRTRLLRLPVAGFVYNRSPKARRRGLRLPKRTASGGASRHPLPTRSGT
jgi:Mrp family chromosome partitioning ATPase